MGGSDHEKRVKTEIRWCMTYDQADSCKGAGGMKFRRVCVWCPKFMDNQRRKEDKENEKDH